jgi:hypothetical protein
MARRLALEVTGADPGQHLVGAVDRPQQPAAADSLSIWRPAAAAAGLGAEVTFHDLRHYYASLLIQHGESVKVVQRRLGHKSAVETLDTYSHLWPDSEDRTREAVDQMLGQPAEADQEAAPLRVCAPEVRPPGGADTTIEVRRLVQGSSL